MEPAGPSDIDGKPEGRVRGSERVKRPTTVGRLCQPPFRSICLSVAVASAQVICPSTAGSEIAMIVFLKEMLAHANAR